MVSCPQAHAMPDPALNLAPFHRWTLRDVGSQRRFALRCADRIQGAAHALVGGAMVAGNGTARRGTAVPSNPSDAVLRARCFAPGYPRAGSTASVLFYLARTVAVGARVLVCCANGVCWLTRVAAAAAAAYREQEIVPSAAGQQNPVSLHRCDEVVGDMMRMK